MQITYNNAVTVEKDKVVEAATKQVTAPVLCDFVGWVLNSAREKGIKRLYFLARDGWIMYNAAERIKAKYKLHIELKYLFCSRMSLRLAALSDLGGEAYRYLLEGGFALTPAVILGRLRLDAEQRKSVYKDIGFEGDENMEMGKAVAAAFCDKLRNSAVYNGFIRDVSDRCKQNAMTYLLQEGLLSDEQYALVDSGWTGSMQRMFRVLTGKKQTGFYFGLYSKPSGTMPSGGRPKSGDGTMPSVFTQGLDRTSSQQSEHLGRHGNRANAEDGEFNAYLFDKSTSPRLVSRFNNHLFEALCSAPHGMTVGYEVKDGEAVPIFNNEKSLNSGLPLLDVQEQGIYGYIESSYTLPDRTSSMKERQEFAFPLLDSLMFMPSREIAESYGALRFSDDPAELYSFPLAAALEDTRQLYLLPRLKEKYFRRDKPARPVYWGYATAALSGKGKFCRLNLRLWEILWLLKR